MTLGRGKNRRRTDAAERVAEVRSLAGRIWFVLWRVTVAGAVCAGALVGGVHTWRWATTSPTFALSTITVEGNVRADAGEVSRLAGLWEGQNLFLLDVPAARRAAEGHPWVRSADVTRHFPQAVSITVEEHEPAAVATLGDLYLVDRDGTPFKRLTVGDELDLPLITGVTREQYVERPEQAAQLFRRALETIDAYTEALDEARASSRGTGTKSADGDLDAVSELQLRGDELTLVTRGGVEIRIGLALSEDKLERLARVRAELGRRGLTAEVIHLDNRARPGWVTVKTSTPALERRRESVQ